MSPPVIRGRRHFQKKMELLEGTRVSTNRQVTCWKDHTSKLCDLAFKYLDQSDKEMVEAMKDCWKNGDSCPSVGDKLYDIIYRKVNKKQGNTYFLFSSITDGYWKDVILLKPVAGYKAYKKFDYAFPDMSTFDIVFGMEGPPNKEVKIPLGFLSS